MTERKSSENRVVDHRLEEPAPRGSGLDYHVGGAGGATDGGSSASRSHFGYVSES